MTLSSALFRQSSGPPCGYLLPTLHAVRKTDHGRHYDFLLLGEQTAVHQKRDGVDSEFFSSFSPRNVRREMQDAYIWKLWVVSLLIFCTFL